jgi:hypothetical protein
LRVRRSDRIKNVTLAWYYEPSRADEVTITHALYHHTGRSVETLYTGLWAIPGALIDPQASAATGAANFSARIVLRGGCVAGVCGGKGGGCVPGPLGDDIVLAIWPTQAAAKAFVQDTKSVMGTDEQDEQIKNASIEWRCHPTNADRALVKAALHY